GILNVTPDSFSGDGVSEKVTVAVQQGMAMVAAGADLLDIGGESTRPGALPVSLEEELQRVVPVVRELAHRVNTPISVDTSKPEVMVAALEAGAALINDVTALRGSCEMSGNIQTAQMLAARRIPTILMHMQNQPATMQQAPCYTDVVCEVYDFLAQRIDFCLQQGIARNRLLCDLGIGFGKSHDHNLALLRKRRVFRGLGVPLLLGLSRKRLIGALTGETEPNRRDVGTHLLGVLADANILRVHDVAGAKQALAIANGLWHASLDEAA
ncbi:MAG: dihydropteroate synthase, partial [Magnetococcales bacterium]|nr:dihydropteroate synthase [Magnetococcales bacterium]